MQISNEINDRIRQFLDETIKLLGSLPEKSRQETWHTLLVSYLNASDVGMSGKVLQTLEHDAFNDQLSAINKLIGSKGDIPIRNKYDIHPFASTSQSGAGIIFCTVKGRVHIALANHIRLKELHYVAGYTNIHYTGYDPKVGIYPEPLTDSQRSAMEEKREGREGPQLQEEEKKESAASTQYSLAQLFEAMKSIYTNFYKEKNFDWTRTNLKPNYIKEQLAQRGIYPNADPNSFGAFIREAEEELGIILDKKQFPQLKFLPVKHGNTLFMDSWQPSRPQNSDDCFLCYLGEFDVAPNLKAGSDMKANSALWYEAASISYDQNDKAQLTCHAIQPNTGVKEKIHISALQPIELAFRKLWDYLIEKNSSEKQTWNGAEKKISHFHSVLDVMNRVREVVPNLRMLPKDSPTRSFYDDLWNYHTSQRRHEGKAAESLLTKILVTTIYLTEMITQQKTPQLQALDQLLLNSTNELNSRLEARGKKNVSVSNVYVEVTNQLASANDPNKNEIPVDQQQSVASTPTAPST